MAIPVQQKGDRVVLDLSGELTFAKRQEFPKAIAQGLALGPRLLLCDLRKVTNLDSSGLAMLVIAAEQCKQTSAQLGLICSDGKIKDLIHIVNLHQSVKLFDSETEANIASSVTS